MNSSTAGGSIVSKYTIILVEDFHVRSALPCHRRSLFPLDSMLNSVIKNSASAVSTHSNYIRLFLNEGKPMVALLQSAISKNLHSDIENDWLNHQLNLGTAAQLHVIDPCPRCVMTTLAQGDLPRNLDILRTVGAAQ